MAEITYKLHFMVDLRQEIYVDGNPVANIMSNFDSFNPDAQSLSYVVENREEYNNNADEIKEKENEGIDLIDTEIEEIKESLTKKGVVFNPDANPFDPGERNDEDDGGSDDDSGSDEDDGGSDDNSDDKHFTDPGDGGSDIPEK